VDPVELGRRTGVLPPPLAVVWESLTDPFREGTRPWLELLEDETAPRILEAARPSLVVWSSIWPHTPEVVIRFELAPRDRETALTWTATSPEALDASAVGHRRFRLNKLLWEDLRESYGQ
jgi:hypothetical protein